MIRIRELIAVAKSRGFAYGLLEHATDELNGAYCGVVRLLSCRKTFYCSSKWMFVHSPSGYLSQGAATGGYCDEFREAVGRTILRMSGNIQYTAQGS